mmetsp:Transcript_104210/g.179604  ORF Transcript_104210/g.179604 Transcript_104210/m.179604 type:complete len:193 (-) Transcript_104210:60-638(-)
MCISVICEWTFDAATAEGLSSHVGPHARDAVGDLQALGLAPDCTRHPAPLTLCMYSPSCMFLPPGSGLLPIGVSHAHRKGDMGPGEQDPVKGAPSLSSYWTQAKECRCRLRGVRASAGATWGQMGPLLGGSTPWHTINRTRAHTQVTHTQDIKQRWHPSISQCAVPKFVWSFPTSVRRFTVTVASQVFWASS